LIEVCGEQALREEALGIPKPARPVKLLIGMIAQDPKEFEKATSLLQLNQGPLDFESLPKPWDYTPYYAEELGPSLIRKFIFFERLITPDELWKMKRATNEIEKQTGQVVDGKLHRRVNLDPGYLTQSKVVLATTKDFAHRIYLQEGIYAEVTLIYQGRSFQPMPYTYPDYRTKEYLELFNQAREVYSRAVHSFP
jgi:hypothetical protein